MYRSTVVAQSIKRTVGIKNICLQYFTTHNKTISMFDIRCKIPSAFISLIRLADLSKTLRT